MRCRAVEIELDPMNSDAWEIYWLTQLGEPLGSLVLDLLRLQFTEEQGADLAVRLVTLAHTINKLEEDRVEREKERARHARVGSSVIR